MWILEKINIIKQKKKKNQDKPKEKSVWRIRDNSENEGKLKDKFSCLY